MPNTLDIVSIFSGCGGLDLGFHRAGFNVIWANDFDQTILPTYERNHPDTPIDPRSIADVEPKDVPDCLGIIGGPPCQSWSEAGAQRGLADPRGKVFLDYVRILEAKQPLFFLAENVSGMLAKNHANALGTILTMFEDAGYSVDHKLLNAMNYGVPQDRQRVIFVGYRKDLKLTFKFPPKYSYIPTLKDAIWDLKDTAVPALGKNYANNNLDLPNHEYFIGSFSTIYMSRNRVRSWDEPSYTIQAGGRHAPIHPQANKMLKVSTDVFKFDPKSNGTYRRLSVRECARVQTFPDNFIFVYKNVSDGYKMVGNAVPVNFAYALADQIKNDLCIFQSSDKGVECFQSTDFSQLKLDLN